MIDLFLNRKGFTLVEIIVIVAIISILSALTIPNITNYLSSNRRSISILQTYISEVSDDSFNRIVDNYLCIHLRNSVVETEKIDFENSEERNGLGVYNLVNGKLVLSKSRILKHRKFPNNFKLESVTINDGESISAGNVFIPFYSNGESEPFTIKINSSNKDIILIKSRISKKTVTVNE